MNDFVEKTIVDQELDILVNFVSPTKELHDYLLTNKRDINSAIKIEISHARWFVKYMSTYIMLLEKYSNRLILLFLLALFLFLVYQYLKIQKYFKE